MYECSRSLFCSNIFSFSEIKTNIKKNKKTDPSTQPLPFLLGHAQSREEERGAAGARFPSLVSGLTASCAATTTTTSWISYIQLD